MNTRLVLISIITLFIMGCNNSNNSKTYDSDYLNISLPINNEVYKSSSIPLYMVFSSGVNKVDIHDKDYNQIYTTTSNVLVLESSLKSTQLNNGSNDLFVTAYFENGAVVKKDFKVNIQNEPSPDSTIRSKRIYTITDFGIVDIVDVYNTFTDESIDIFMDIEYSDGYVKQCTNEIVLSVSDETLVSSNANNLSFLKAGYSSVTVTCQNESVDINIVAENDYIVGISVSTNNILIEGVGSSFHFDVMEHTARNITRPSTNFNVIVENTTIVDVIGTTVTSKLEGSTRITLSKNGMNEIIIVDVLPLIGSSSGVINIAQGGVLQDSNLIGDKVVVVKALFPSHAVSLDKNFTVSIRNPNEINYVTKPDQIYEIYFQISPDELFSKQVIVRLPNIIPLNSERIVLVSKIDSKTRELVQVTIAEIDRINNEVIFQIWSGGEYILHSDNEAPNNQPLKPSRKASQISKFNNCSNPFTIWPNDSNFSVCDDVRNNYLKQYRPILMVNKSNTLKNATKPGEFPIRVSDLLRNGKLFNLTGDNKEINYSSSFDNNFKIKSITEANSEKILRENDCNSKDDECIELRIIHENMSDWRQYAGIPTVYGRVAYTKYDGKPFVALQYWMFYAGSTLPADYLFTGEMYHEGDVEFFQVMLDENLMPVGASAGQHYYGESRNWNKVEKVDGHPVLYIASGSHATYFDNKNVASGTKHYGFLSREGNALNAGNEIVSDSVIKITPAVIQKESGNIVYKWKGRFGAYVFDAPGTDGPPAPLYRGPNDEVGLSMFNYPAHFHFTYLMPGEVYAGFMEKIARNRSPEFLIKKVLQGECIHKADSNALLFSTMSQNIYDIYHKTGYQNYLFLKNTSSCVNSKNSKSYFDIFYSNNYCEYSNESISDTYRRYVVSGLSEKYNIIDSMPLTEMLKIDDPSCALMIVDTDNDGILNTEDTDDDNDGLSDTGELECGTDPLLADTDNDGTNDQQECAGGTDPLKQNGYVFITSDINMFAQAASFDDNNILITNILSSANGKASLSDTIKFYDGHGGNVGEPTTIDAARQFIEGLGYQFVYSNEASLDVAGLRALFILYPGRTTPNNISVDEINKIKDFVRNGGVVIAVAENGGYHSNKTSYNKLLSDLGIEVINNNDDIQRTVVTSSIEKSSVTYNVNNLTIMRPSTFTVDPAVTGNEIVIRLNDGKVIMVKSIIDYNYALPSRKASKNIAFSKPIPHTINIYNDSTY